MRFEARPCPDCGSLNTGKDKDGKWCISCGWAEPGKPCSRCGRKSVDQARHRVLHSKKLCKASCPK